MTRRPTDPTTEAAIACIHAGLMTPTEAAEAFGLNQSALWKRCKAIGFDPAERRAHRLRKLASVARFRQWKLPKNWKQPSPLA